LALQHTRRTRLMLPLEPVYVGSPELNRGYEREAGNPLRGRLT